jgi:hypothetical protein
MRWAYIAGAVAFVAVAVGLCAWWIRSGAMP